MPADLVRGLGVLAEPPAPERAQLSEMLGLGALPPKSEHADLFLFNVYPYASVYLGPEGQLGGEARSRIAGFWNALGIDVPAEPDHITSLLGLLGGLIERSGTEDDDSRRLLLHEAAGACLFEHIVPWTSPFLHAVRIHGSEFYALWANLLNRTLMALADTFGLTAEQRLPVHLITTEPIRTPELIGGSAFLEQLLAPIRTGVVVSRQDMARLGRDVGLGARIGERRYMLEAYLGQDPQGSLEWMASHAAEWIERDASSVPLIDQFWSTRAASSVGILREAASQASETSFADIKPDEPDS